MDKTEKNKNLTRKIKKQAKGITLIALVVTIIVLLILAGVALNLTIGQNGIFTRANEAVIINENANVYEQLQLVITDYQMEDIENKTSTNILDKLASNGIINEDNSLNVDTLMGKSMKTGKGSIEEGDVYVLEQREKMASIEESSLIGDLDYYLIYYNSDKIDKNLGLAFENSSSNNSNVKITISKDPDTNEPTGGVALKVQSIEGIDSTINLNELDISSLSQEQKIGIYFVLYLKYFNLNYEDFEEYLQSQGLNYQGLINMLSQTKESEILEIINELKGKGIETIDGYVILNPDEKFSKSYVAIENGEYTFKVKEILTQKTYENSVKISNIDKSKLLYSVKDNVGKVILVDKEQNATEFEEAYIIYNGEKINVTDCIRKEQENCNVDICDVVIKLENTGKVEDRFILYGTTQIFELVKDGVSYFGDVVMRWEE